MSSLSQNQPSLRAASTRARQSAREGRNERRSDKAVSCHINQMFL